MAEFMDVHRGMVDITPDALMEAHNADLAIQGEVGVVRLQQRLGRDVDHAPVDVHELRHRAPPVRGHLQPGKHIWRGRS